MIQDIAPYQFDNQWKVTQPADDDYVMMFSKGCVMARIADTPDSLAFPTVREVLAAGGEREQLRYLFSITDTSASADTRSAATSTISVATQNYFLLRAPDLQLSGFVFTDLRQIRDTPTDDMYKIMAMMTAKHLDDWYRDTQFCGRCGCRTCHSERERAMVCTDENCGYTMYPRIMPAVIVGVTNGDKLLLTKYRTGFGHNALIAGFTEIGETLEETVAREVMEEAGLRVKNIRYYKSQPWGLANDILAGYWCDVDGDTTIRMDANELKEAHWVERKDIVLQPSNVSLTNEMMSVFKSSAG